MQSTHGLDLAALLNRTVARMCAVARTHTRSHVRLDARTRDRRTRFFLISDNVLTKTHARKVMGSHVFFEVRAPVCHWAAWD